MRVTVALLQRGVLSTEDKNDLLPSIDQHPPLLLPEVSVSVGSLGSEGE